MRKAAGPLPFDRSCPTCPTLHLLDSGGGNEKAPHLQNLPLWLAVRDPKTRLSIVITVINRGSPPHEIIVELRVSFAVETEIK